MLEVEVKFHCDDFAPVEQQLVKWAAKELESRHDADAYFNAPHRDFGQTDEALRVRRIGHRNCVTYKGPRIDAETKTRREIEVPLADGSQAEGDFRALLVALGFRPVAEVRKRRRVFEFTRDGHDVQACLDDVQGVGRFVELEIMVPESAFASAKSVVLDSARTLGLTRMERRSYLELLLETLRT